MRISGGGGGGDGFSIDLGAIPGIVKSLGDRARDAQGAVGSIKGVLSTADGLNVGAAISALTDAQRQMSNIQNEFFTLQQDVGTRAIELAQAEGNTTLADALAQAMKPPTHSSFWGTALGVVHDVLNIGGFVPGLNELTSGLNALIYIGQGDWKDAALNGIALIPLGKGVTLVVKVAEDSGKVAQDAADASKAVRYAQDFFNFAKEGASSAEDLAKHPIQSWDAALAQDLRKDDSLVPDAATKKSDAWQAYQDRGGTWSYDQWSKTYDANQTRATNAAAVETTRQQELGWPSHQATVDTSTGETRRIDIANPATMQGEEVKSGYATATADNISEIERDKQLIADGWTISWYFVGTASKPLLERLTEAGIPYSFAK